MRDVRVEGQTASGRARASCSSTGGGDVTIRGNDVRYVLRQVGGDILPTTVFCSSRRNAGTDGQLSGGRDSRSRAMATASGMCQWGAIARARAGDDFRAILKAYYPGADLTRAP